MFSDANLAKPKVKFSHKSNKRDPDEVATRETDLVQAILALNNYRMITRLVECTNISLLSIFSLPG